MIADCRRASLAGRGRALAVLAALLLAAPAAAEPLQLAPWKDELFAYPRILGSEAGGAAIEVEYHRPRDLHARDAVRGEKVKPDYVSLDTDAASATLTYNGAGRTLKVAAVGKLDGARIIVVFVHGRGAGYEAGVDDWIHGGNFNRIKNLMMRNGGLYLSPAFTDFSSRGAAEIRALVLSVAARSPGAPVFLACGSAGANICWRLVADPSVGPRLGGLLLIDAAMSDAFLRRAVAAPPESRLPIAVFGSREDTVLGWRRQLAFVRDLRTKAPGYPARHVLFSAGTHGLSLRMLDWRDTLNWMLAAKGG